MNRELEQFFTNDEVSSLLVSSLSVNTPQVAVDVGVGEGSLLTAVQSRWGEARLLGIDLDKTLVDTEKEQDIEKIHGNGLDHRLPFQINEICGGVDLAVNNPPYKSIARTKSTDIILRDAGLLPAVRKSQKYPAEIVFLAQNLRILTNKGTLAIIVPSGIINNDRWERLREILLDNHAILKVIELPERAFKKTEAKTYIVILRKGGVTKRIFLYKASQEGSLSRSIPILKNQAKQRMDWSHYNNLALLRHSTPFPDSRFTLQELGVEIFRGQLSNTEATSRNITVFHTSSMSGVGENYNVGNRNRVGEYRFAESGDILVARVGSRCIGRTGLITSGKITITDCILVIRIKKLKLRGLVWEKISSKEFQTYLIEQARGVCAQYITQKQLLEINILD